MDERAARIAVLDYPAITNPLTYGENYFTTKYQSIPKDGCALVQNMLDGSTSNLGRTISSLGNWQLCQTSV